MVISTLATLTTGSSPQAALSESKPCVQNLHRQRERVNLDHVEEAARQEEALVAEEEGLDNFFCKTILVVNGLF
jgi:hypothetical protein